jgi:pimeloyl-ACP methyl ester carboxylesterase
MSTHNTSTQSFAKTAADRHATHIMQPVRKEKWQDVPTRTIDVGGVAFAYRDLGPDSGVPVIFLHHLMAVLDDWDPRVIDGIAAKRRVIAFDNRGVGASTGRVPDTVEEMGRDAIAFIRAMGFTQVDLLGFSLGGGVAQMVALQAPDLVRRIVLAGTGPRGGGIEKVTKVAVMAYIKAALTWSDARHFLFFPRTPEGKRGTGLLHRPENAQHKSRQGHFPASPACPIECHQDCRAECARRSLGHHAAGFCRQW